MNKNQKILIGISGILIYLISLKMYDLMTDFAQYLLLQNEMIQKNILLLIYLILGLLSVAVFIMLFNKITSRQILSLSTMLKLFLALVLLSLAVGFSNKLLAVFLSKMENLDIKKTNYFLSYSLHSGVRVYFPIVVFVYYLRKVKQNDLTH